MNNYMLYINLKDFNLPNYVWIRRKIKQEVNKRTLLTHQAKAAVRYSMDKAEEELIAERKKESLKRTSQKA